MKKTAILTLGAFLLISGSAMAQENEEVRYNQYGVAVDRKELQLLTGRSYMLRHVTISWYWNQMTKVTNSGWTTA